MLAVAASPTDNAPEARAYMNFEFGGQRVLPRNFHYGLRLDRDRRYSALPVPFMQMDFDAQGNVKTHLNGMYLMRRSLIATQDEAAAGGAESVAADASAEASVDAAAAEAAPADAAVAEAAPADAAASDPFATETAAAEAAPETIPVEGGEAAAAEGTAYTAADWGLIVLGAAGVAYAGYEVSKSDDDSAAAASGNSTGGGGTTGGGATGGLLGGLLLGGSTMMEKLSQANNTNMAREYVEWLDGGSGHMGDLEAAR